MVLEHGVFEIKPGSEDQFEQAVAAGAQLIAQTPGFISLELTRGIEGPSTFLLLIRWESLEAHTEGFRGSERFPQWRSLIGPHFAADPAVAHFTSTAVKVSA